MKKYFIIENIEGYRISHNLSKTQFCKKCEIGLSVYKKILKQQTNFRADAIFKIARYMKVKIKDIYDERD